MKECGKWNFQNNKKKDNQLKIAEQKKVKKMWKKSFTIKEIEENQGLYFGGGKMLAYYCQYK